MFSIRISVLLFSLIVMYSSGVWGVSKIIRHQWFNLNVLNIVHTFKKKFNSEHICDTYSTTHRSSLFWLLHFIPYVRCLTQQFYSLHNQWIYLNVIALRFVQYSVNNHTFNNAISVELNTAFWKLYPNFFISFVLFLFCQKWSFFVREYKEIFFKKNGWKCKQKKYPN